MDGFPSRKRRCRFLRGMGRKATELVTLDESIGGYLPATWFQPTRYRRTGFVVRRHRGKVSGVR